jgi:PBP1b-binding outer membrane lipoprotein LpoB
MKKLLIISALLLTACSTTQTVQSVQTTTVQACTAYKAAFDTALAARKAGKLNQTQINQITMLDSQIYPICHPADGNLPVDANDATQKITAAVTTLTILEAVK